MAANEARFRCSFRICEECCAPNESRATHVVPMTATWWKAPCLKAAFRHGSSGHAVSRAGHTAEPSVPGVFTPRSLADRAAQRLQRRVRGPSPVDTFLHLSSVNRTPAARLSSSGAARVVAMTPRLLDVTPWWCHYGGMELGQYVSDLQRQLVDAAENGTEDTRAVAERLAAGLDAAARLVLLDVLSAAAGEITRDLAPGSVDMRLRGRDIEFVVTPPNTEPDSDERPAATVDLDDASTSRTTLRLPDALKARVDEAAAADGMSVNTWLVRAIAAALQPKQRRSTQRTLRTGDNFAGWAR